MAHNRSVRQRVTDGLKAFREEFLTTQNAANEFEEWSNYDARKLRYTILWAFYQNTAYRNIHKWSQSYRTEYALYKFHGYRPCPSQTPGKFRPERMPVPHYYR